MNVRSVRYLDRSRRPTIEPITSGTVARESSVVMWQSVSKERSKAQPVGFWQRRFSDPNFWIQVGLFLLVCTFASHFGWALDERNGVEAFADACIRSTPSLVDAYSEMRHAHHALGLDTIERLRDDGRAVIEGASRV
jgi:hypothetical protein